MKDKVPSSYVGVRAAQLDRQVSPMAEPYRSALSNVLWSSLGIAVGAGAVLFFAGLSAVFLLYSPGVSVIDWVAKFIGLPRGGELFGVVGFLTLVVFAVTVTLKVIALKMRHSR